MVFPVSSQALVQQLNITIQDDNIEIYSVTTEVRVILIFTGHTRRSCYLVSKLCNQIYIRVRTILSVKSNYFPKV